MEALIMSCSTGGGHNSAGMALADELKKRGHNVTFLDPYTLAGEKVSLVISNSYVKLVQKSPRIFGFAYFLAEKYRHLPIKSPVYRLNRRMVPHMRRYLSENHFDFILMPHLYPTLILANLRNTGFEVPPTVLISTDYACIPFMEESNCDLTVTACDLLEPQYVGYGIPREKLRSCGIPVRAAFTDGMTREEARKTLGYEPEIKYLLLSGGSIGAGKLTTALRSLVSYMSKREDIRLTVVCGNNEKLFRRLSVKYSDNNKLVILKSTDKMAVYMKACDCFIGKPGGLSSTEAAVTGTPLIHLAPIPGCETINAAFFAGLGMSLYVRKPRREIKSALIRIFDENYAKEMKNAQAKYINRHAASDICDCVEELLRQSRKTDDNTEEQPSGVQA